MPEPWRDEESETRKACLFSKSRSASNSPSYASCPSCPGRNRTPILHRGCSPDNLDGVAGAGLTKLTTEKQDNDNKSVASSSYQQPECSDVRECEARFAAVSLGDPGNTSVSIPNLSTMSEVSVPSHVLKGKSHQADDTTDVSEVSAKTNHKRIRELSSQEFLQNKECKKIRDLPDQPGSSTGRGRCMQLCRQGHCNGEWDMEGDIITIFQPSFSFEFENPACEITPHQDELYIPVSGHFDLEGVISGRLRRGI